jgi:geranylgeranyl pyrophosphate synthase
MQVLIPESGGRIDSQRNPGEWVSLPGLCCLAAGGKIEKTLEISAAWLLIYTAAHVADTIEDGDEDPIINQLGGIGAAINAANGLFLSAIDHLLSLQNKSYPDVVPAEIISDFLSTILVMTSGQHLDLTISQLDLDSWWRIAEAKSGSFFSLASRSGARLGQSDARAIQAFSEYGFHLGLMLQIHDDLADFQLLLNSSEAISPALFRGSLASAYASDVLPDKSKGELVQLTSIQIPAREPIGKLIDIFDSCGAGLYMMTELEKHFDLGKTCLANAEPRSPAGDYLAALINDLKID